MNRVEPRFYCPMDLSQGATRDLPALAAHHAARVLRLKVGDIVTLFNGDGAEAQGHIQAITKTRVAVRVAERRERDVEAALSVALVQSLSARERMDFTIQKAVELGVAEIYPVHTRRSIMRLEDERANRRVEHWQNLAISACEQCGRNRVPLVHPVTDLPQWLGTHDAQAGNLRVMLSIGAGNRLRDLPAPSAVTLLAGPEGGFDPQEVEMLRGCAFNQVQLGPRVLRTETAALAALSAMHALWGDF
jgi:16S rRNA (uracil1498-N3)-methyltransferase